MIYSIRFRNEFIKQQYYNLEAVLIDYALNLVGHCFIVYGNVERYLILKSVWIFSVRF